MAQGRAAAWTKLFRRLTTAANWRRQPALDEKALERLIRGFEVANERRSTTRYLADVNFHFNPNAVRNVAAPVQHRLYGDTFSSGAGDSADRWKAGL